MNFVRAEEWVGRLSQTNPDVRGSGVPSVIEVEGYNDTALKSGYGEN